MSYLFLALLVGFGYVLFRMRQEEMRLRRSCAGRAERAFDLGLDAARELASWPAGARAVYDPEAEAYRIVGRDVSTTDVRVLDS
jgi:hypothetical protein